MSTDDSQRTIAAANETGRRKGRLFPPVWVWCVLGVVAAVIVTVCATDVTASHALANLVTLIAAFVGLMTLLAWFSLLSGYSRRVRWTPPVVLLCAVGVHRALYRIDGTSSELIPRFAFRWSPKPDELLPRPKTSTARVDLRTTGEYDFPEFLGPLRGLAVENVRLARDWDKRPPKLLWRQPIGAGWSAFSVLPAVPRRASRPRTGL